MAASTKSVEGTSSSTLLTHIARILYSCVVLLVFFYYDTAQALVNNIWSFLLTNWFFKSVYFETWWVVIVYAIILIAPFSFNRIRFMDRYKIDSDMSWQDAGLKTVALEIMVYCAPLMLFDTFIVKKYWGVESSEVEKRCDSWIQYTRALPISAPTVSQLIYQLVFSFIIYDCLFCCVHLTLHKNLWLYKNLHAQHHEHGFVHSRVTNQLSIAERVILVLSANQSLKIMRAHPLTRAVFVIVFVCWLTENHCGYDLPWTLDKVVPFGLIGGARQHAEHHVKGSRNYQPFFTYIDKFIINRKSKVA